MGTELTLDERQEIIESASEAKGKKFSRVVIEFHNGELGNLEVTEKRRYLKGKRII